MDRHRFSDRQRKLLAEVDKLISLKKMTDRVTVDDLNRWAELMQLAAGDLRELVEANLPGCICRRIENDNYSYLDYAESCRHHGSLFHMQAELKKRYELAEKKLKDEVRMSIVREALSGTVDMPTTLTVQGLVTRAIEIADEAIRQLTGGTK